MKQIEIRLTDTIGEQPPFLDWIPEDRLDGVLSEAESAGYRVEIIGPVSANRQLAHMENNAGIE